MSQNKMKVINMTGQVGCSNTVYAAIYTASETTHHEIYEHFNKTSNSTGRLQELPWKFDNHSTAK